MLQLRVVGHLSATAMGWCLSTMSNTAVLCLLCRRHHFEHDGGTIQYNGHQQRVGHVLQQVRGHCTVQCTEAEASAPAALKPKTNLPVGTTTQWWVYLKVQQCLLLVQVDLLYQGVGFACWQAPFGG